MARRRKRAKTTTSAENENKSKTINYGKILKEFIFDLVGDDRNEDYHDDEMQVDDEYSDNSQLDELYYVEIFLNGNDPDFAQRQKLKYFTINFVSDKNTEDASFDRNIMSPKFKLFLVLNQNRIWYLVQISDDNKQFRRLYAAENFAYRYSKEFFNSLKSKQLHFESRLEPVTGNDFRLEFDIFLFQETIHHDYGQFVQNLNNFNRPITNLVAFLTDPRKKSLVEIDNDENFALEPELRLTVDRFYRCLAAKQEKHLNHQQFQTIPVNCQDLNPKLWRHQKDAIQWMLHRETGEQKSEVARLFTKKTLSDQPVYYFEALGHFVDENVYQRFCQETKRSSGGILADEMGLGKTVDVIALITNNRKPKTETKYPFFAAEKLFGATGDALKGDLQCYCGAESVTIEENERVKDRAQLVDICMEQKYYRNENMIKCLMCGNYQHIECSSYKIDDDEFPYLCSRCWLQVEPVDSPATLIVCPNAILAQWIQELQKHVRSTVKIFKYNGVKSKDYILPPKLAQNDIVITTYDILKTEIDYITSHNYGHLRNAKRYFSAISPLSSIVWWRMCFDEAQMVEGGVTTKTVKMANSLQAVYRWAVTGTPIFSGIQDLFGLVMFIRHKPYNHEAVWKNALYQPMLEGRISALIDAVYPCFWRTEIKNVFHTLQLRQPIVQTEYIDLSQIERDFYLQKSNDYCYLINEKLHKFDPGTKIKELSHTVQRAIIDAALKLRQICCHPQFQLGFNQKSNEFYSLQDVLDRMIEDCRYQGEKSHREMISAINGMAAVHLFGGQIKLAIETYREALASIDGKQDIRTDKTQKYHIYYNMALVMDALGCQQVNVNGELYKPFNGGLPIKIEAEAELAEMPAIDPETDKLWRLKAKQLYDDYLNGARLSCITCDQYRREMAKRCQKALDEMKLVKRWFVYALQQLANVMTPAELSTAIGDLLSDVEQMHNSSVHYFILKLNDYWSSFQKLRQKLGHCFSQHLNPESLQQNASDMIACHVAVVIPDHSCHLCLAKAIINEFEELIFQSVSNLNNDDADEDSGDPNRRPAAEDNDRRMMETNWNESNQLVAMRRIGAMFKARAVHATDFQTVCQEIDRFLVFLDECKKEYKAHRKYWIQAAEFILRIDELNQAQTRLHFLNQDLDPFFQELRYTRDKAAKQLQIDEGRLRYLHSLKKKTMEKDDNNQTWMCVVCAQDLDRYAVLTCGHITCVQCLYGVKKAAQMAGLQTRCPVCRTDFSTTKVCYIEQCKHPEVTVKGYWSSKMVQIIRTVKKILDTNEKILIFSSWSLMLDLMAKALKMNDIASVTIDGQANFGEKIDRFKRPEENVNVMLLLTSFAAEGLNLTEASHVIFINSMLHRSNELQAIGRVHRMGQTRQTYVYKFIARDTVEQLIEDQTVATPTDPASENRTTTGNEFTNMTINQFCSLFSVYRSNE